MSENKQWDNRNRGVLFKAKLPKKSDNHPDYSGTVNIEGKEFWLNGWEKTSKNGNKFFSLSTTPKKPVYNEGQKIDKPKEEGKSFEPDFTDKIPF